MKCSSLTSLEFPKNLQSIGDCAFSGCSNIEKIHSYVKSPFSINYNVFDNSVFLNAKLYLASAEIAQRYKNQKYWHQFKNVVYPNYTTQIYIYDIKSEGKGTTVVDEYETEMDLGAGASWLQYFNGCTVYNEEVEIEIPHFPGTGVPFVFIPDEGYILKQVLYASEKDGELVDVTSDLKYEKGKGYTYRTTDKGSYPTLIATFAKDVQSLLEDDKNIIEDNIIFVKQSDNSIAVTDGVDATERYEIPSAVKSDGVEFHVNAIAPEAFKDNEALTEVVIPESVESIGESAFDGCINLESIYCNKKEPIALGGKSKTRSSEGDDEDVTLTVFSGVDKQTCILYVPKGSAEKYRVADGWKDFKKIVGIYSGDANGDGSVNNADVTAITSHIMGNTPEKFFMTMADVNGDGKVNVADIVELINLINTNNKKMGEIDLEEPAVEPEKPVIGDDF